MKLINLSVALALTVSLAAAQTNPAPDTSTPTTPTTTAPATPAPVKKRPAVNTVQTKTPPNVPDTRGAGWEKRALSNIEKAKAQAASIQVIFDGDSITDFWQTHGKQIWTDRYAKYSFDFGISGDWTQSVLWRLAHGQAEGLQPKLIFLMIGTNNMSHVATPEEIAGGVKEIITQYQKVCPDAVIVLQAIFPRAAEPTDPYRLKVKATNEFLAKLGDGTKVIYIDFGDKFLTPDGVLNKDIMTDLLHPTAKGYQIWADAIQPTIDKYLAK